MKLTGNGGDKPDWASISGLAVHWGISVPTINRMIRKDPNFPMVWVGGQRRVDLNRADRYLLDQVAQRAA